jgi:hypothetical protein
MSAPLPLNHGNATVTVVSAGDPEPMSFGWAFSIAEPVTAAGAAALITTALVDNGITVSANYHTGWSIPTLTVQVRKVAGITEHVQSLASVGSASGGTCPSNVAVLVRKTAAVLGRKNRGRMYLPPFSLSAANVDRLGTIATAAFNTLTTRYSGLFDDLVSAAIPPVILHADESTPTAVTGFVVQSTVATQRTRLRK